MELNQVRILQVTGRQARRPLRVAGPDTGVDTVGAAGSAGRAGRAGSTVSR
ncbi:hypothetical protein PC116_g30452 [Phytophthora cactorum]|nr:hypothetical protein PC116_g30452 [Phytophthora cactorum]